MPSPTQKSGALQEEAAERLLSKFGYRIVERNWRGAGGEIDRIGWDDEILCFVEVRSRNTDRFGLPEETVGLKKQKALIRAARSYLLRFSPGEVPMVRFDVVSVLCRPGSPPALRLIQGAFEASAYGSY